jgi:hypothetical protein
VQGLLVSGQSIFHAAGDDTAAPAANFTPMALGPDKNLASWEAWVRASLYLSDVLKDLSWTPPDPLPSAVQPRKIVMEFDSKAFLTLTRPDMNIFRQQLALVRTYADQRADRATEILTQVGYPTPYFASLLGLNARNPKTFELIAITQVIASHVVMIAKHHLACRRPDRLGASVMPMLTTPGHSTFPSGHATEAFAVRTVLSGLLDDQKLADHYPSRVHRKALLAKQAERIAVNRTVAGLHFPIDTWAGAALGEAVGEMILARCRATDPTGTIIQTMRPRTYAAKNTDFFVKNFDDAAKASSNGLTRQAAVHVDESELFKWLWQQAVDEFTLA